MKIQTNSKNLKTEGGFNSYEILESIRTYNQTEVEIPKDIIILNKSNSPTYIVARYYNMNNEFVDNKNFLWVTLNSENVLVGMDVGGTKFEIENVGKVGIKQTIDLGEVFFPQIKAGA